MTFSKEWISKEKNEFRKNVIRSIDLSRNGGITVLKMSNSLNFDSISVLLLAQLSTCWSEILQTTLQLFVLFHFNLAKTSQIKCEDGLVFRMATCQ